MPTPALPAPLSAILAASGSTYDPHSQSERDGQLTLIGRLLRPGTEPLHVVIYASEDLEAFGLHLWPAVMPHPPAENAPGVLFEVTEEWTFIDPLYFLLSPLRALRLLAPLGEGDTLRVPAGEGEALSFPVTNDLYLKAGQDRHSLIGSRPYFARLEQGLLLHWKALSNFSRRVRETGRA